MMPRPRLVIFDVDGTLVDSQHTIVAAMQNAFSSLDQPLPDRDAVLSIVGLSLDHAIRQLVPDAEQDTVAALVEAYKAAFMTERKGNRDYAPLYPGAADVLTYLSEHPETLIGIATGKSRRGLLHMLDTHDLHGRFVTFQTADDHPSKPHPSVIHTAIAEAGVDTDDAVMIGDTSFDIQMARNAGVHAIGVSWGYHYLSAVGADRLLQHFNELPGTLEKIWAVSE